MPLSTIFNKYNDKIGHYAAALGRKDVLLDLRISAKSSEVGKTKSGFLRTIVRKNCNHQVTKALGFNRRLVRRSLKSEDGSLRNEDGSSKSEDGSGKPIMGPS